jgi:hypothetical protein
MREERDEENCRDGEGKDGESMKDMVGMEGMVARERMEGMV